MKKAIFAVVAFMLSLSAFAADNIKGTNQDGKVESVPLAVIASYKHVSGIFYYRMTVGGNAVYTLTDPGMALYNKADTYVGLNAKTSTVSGWRYNVSKVKAICDGGSTIIRVPGYGDELISDSCAFVNSL